MLQRWFLAHPRSAGMSYLQHLRTAMGLAIAMLSAGAACLIHSVFPEMFTQTASRTVAALHGRMGGRGGPDDPRAGRSPPPDRAVEGGSDGPALRSSIAPGLLLSLFIAAAAIAIANWVRAPAVLVALVMGLVMAAAVKQPSMAVGSDFAARDLLRLGVVLVGAKVDVSTIEGLGWPVIGVTVAALALTFALGAVAARLIGLDRRLAVLTAASVAVCGASAALAVAAALPRSPDAENETASVIALVTLVGSVAMLSYAPLALAAGLPVERLGAFLGASLHELAQAVGAGYAISERAGAQATAVKLLRVSCLAPVAAIASFAGRSARGAQASGGRAPILPWFLAGFVALAVANSLGLIPAAASRFLGVASQVCLLAAVAALGRRISLSKLVAGGPQLAAAVIVQSLLLACSVLAGLMLISRAG